MINFIKKIFTKNDLEEELLNDEEINLTYSPQLKQGDSKNLLYVLENYKKEDVANKFEII